MTLAEELGLAPYGVELHQGRAPAAQEAVEALLARQGQEIAPSVRHTLSGSYTNLLTGRSGYNLLYLNPPYDWDNEDGGDRPGRLEYQFLWRNRPWLQPDGLLVWMLPQHLLKFRKAAKYILSHFDDMRVYRFSASAKRTRLSRSVR